jgi:Collagen triple helix repeat (20 copies)
MYRNILCATAALFIASQAEAQTTPGQIYACVNNNSGTIHVVAPNANCNTGENLYVWNTVGPQGPPGATGPIGPQGPAGPAGPTGATGAAGANGTNGTNGTNGAAGPAGAQGPQGPAGAQGPQGPAEGISSAAVYFCASIIPPATAPANQPLFFNQASPLMGFGSEISVTGTSFNSIVLQPGVYQVSLFGIGFSTTTPGLNLFLQLNGNIIGGWGAVILSNPPIFYSIIGSDQLVSVSQPNSSLALIPPVDVGNGSCTFSITQLQ